VSLRLLGESEQVFLYVNDMSHLDVEPAGQHRACRVGLLYLRRAAKNKQVSAYCPRLSKPLACLAPMNHRP
jgi:hypothetical protein